MSVLIPLLIGVLCLVANPATSAPICILNLSGLELVLVVDDLAGLRETKLVTSGQRLCLDSSEHNRKASVGVFTAIDVLEGCSRLTRPNQLETLLEFAEYDNCLWQPTDRNFD